LDRDRCGKAIDLDRGAAWRIDREMLLPKPVVLGEIVLHVGEENSDVNDLLPTAAGILQYPAHVLENAAHLRGDVVGNDPPLIIQINARDLFTSAYARAHAAEEKQRAHPPGVRVVAHGFGRLLRIETFHGTKVQRTIS